MKENNFFIWQNNKEIQFSEVPDFANAKLLADAIYNLVKENEYAQSLVSLEEFYRQSLDVKLDVEKQVNVKNCFYIYTNRKEIDAVLNTKIVFDTAEIDFLFVKESQRGKGIAQKLLQQFEETCQKQQHKVEHILLEVGENNVPAVKLYKKWGFEQISVRTNYYKGIKNALIMEKRL